MSVITTWEAIQNNPDYCCLDRSAQLTLSLHDLAYMPYRQDPGNTVSAILMVKKLKIKFIQSQIPVKYPLAFSKSFIKIIELDMNRRCNLSILPDPSPQKEKQRE